MTRTLTILALGITTLTMFGAAVPAAAFDLTSGMPGGSIMGNYQALMNQHGGGYRPGYTVPNYGGCQPSLTIGMPTTTTQDWYRHYHQQLMGLWAATGYGSLAGVGQMNSSYQNAGAARDFWAKRWSQEGSLGKQPIRLNVPNRVVEYAW